MPTSHNAFEKESSGRPRRLISDRTQVNLIQVRIILSSFTLRLNTGRSKSFHSIETNIAEHQPNDKNVSVHQMTRHNRENVLVWICVFHSHNFSSIVLFCTCWRSVLYFEWVSQLCINALCVLFP